MATDRWSRHLQEALTATDPAYQAPLPGRRFLSEGRAHRDALDVVAGNGNQLQTSQVRVVRHSRSSRSLAAIVVAVVATAWLPATSAMAGPAVDVPNLPLDYVYAARTDTPAGYWVTEPTGGDWTVTGGTIGPTGGWSSPW